MNAHCCAPAEPKQGKSYDGRYRKISWIALIAIRAKASLLKAISMATFGIWVLSSALWNFVTSIIPIAETMGLIGVIALTANLGVVALLDAYSEGDSNMRSVWYRR